MEAHRLIEGYGDARHAALARRTAGASVRRGLDLFVALTLLLACLPLLMVVAVAIRCDSRGPALFRQRRLGRDMQPFTCLKFRTMLPDCDAAPHREYVRSLLGAGQRDARPPGALYKLAVDQRVTRLGRVLRAWSLDELPQLWNVVRGDMALVGPRPVIPYEADLYPPEYLRRFTVRPGLTGLWQVSGRNERTYQEMVAFDVRYADSNSLRGDLRILLKTIVVVLRRQGVA